MDPEFLKQLDAICNIGVTIFGLLCIWYVGKKSKWGPIYGLVSEPFWFGTTIINKQCGLVFLCFIYTYLWINAAIRWHRDEKAEKLCEKCSAPLDVA